MNILIVGLGSIAKKHICAINELVKGANIFALRSGLESKPEEGVNDIYSMSELQVRPDFVIISNPTSEHDATIQQMCEYGFPMFIEKPVLGSVENSIEISRRLSSKKILTYVACNLRFHPLIQRLKAEFSKRKPVEMNVYCGSFLPEWRPQQDYRKVYSARKDMGGGVHLDLIHEIDYVRHLLGMPNTTQVYRSKKSALEINSTDIAHYILEYDAASVFITLNYYRRDPKRQIECVWENESWSVDLLKGTITDHLGNSIYASDYDIKQTYEDQMSYFLDCLKNEKLPMNDFDEAVNVLKICLS